MTYRALLDEQMSKVGDWWQTKREKYRDIAALQAMSARDIEELSGEMGLSRASLEALVRAGPHAAGEMQAMMTALDLDPAAAQAAYPAMLRDMKVTCATCGDKPSCRHLLADGTAAALYPTFCPNAVELQEIAKRPDLHSA